MKTEQMSIELLREKEEKYILFIEDLKNAMKCIPDSSILGRMSIMASINMKQKKLSAIRSELERRELKK